MGEERSALGASEMGSGEREGPQDLRSSLSFHHFREAAARGRACSLERQVPPGDRAPSMPCVTPDHSQRVGRGGIGDLVQSKRNSYDTPVA